VLRPFEAPAHRYAPGHRGVDLGAAVGSTVVSPGDGVVAFAGMVAGRPVLSVAGSDGLRSTLEPVVATVAVGTPVAAGEAIGTVASPTGHCPRSCVHWGVRQGRDYVDPLGLVQPRVVLVPVSSRRRA
jgi:murein DD-endopeptidase MepM/ murein hydrolase activator NlpD